MEFNDLPGDVFQIVTVTRRERWQHCAPAKAPAVDARANRASSHDVVPSAPMASSTSRSNISIICSENFV